MSIINSLEKQQISGYEVFFLSFFLSLFIYHVFILSYFLSTLFKFLIKLSFIVF